MSKLDTFYQKYKYPPVKKDIGVATAGKPSEKGEKSKSSLLDKVIRNIEKDGNTSFTLASVPDMARCTIICSSYSEMPKKIQQLKQAFPNLNGYISRCANGYRGIHLNATLNGMKMEIQLSTPKAFEYAQATENIYVKWRSFNPRAKQAEIDSLEEKLANCKDPSEQSNLKLTIKTLKDKLREDTLTQKEEYTMTDDLFKELHEDGDFKSNEIDIESTLLSFKTYDKSSSDLRKELDKPFKIVDGKVDQSYASKYIDKIHKIAKETQAMMLDKISVMTKKGSSGPSIEEKYSKDISQIKIMLTAYNKKIEESIRDKSLSATAYNDNIRDFSIQKSHLAVEFTKFLNKNKIDAKDITPEIIQKFSESLKGNEKQTKSILPTVSSLTDAIMEVIPGSKVKTVSKEELKQAKEDLGTTSTIQDQSKIISRIRVTSSPEKKSQIVQLGE